MQITQVFIQLCLLVILPLNLAVLVHSLMKQRKRLWKYVVRTLLPKALPNRVISLRTISQTVDSSIPSTIPFTSSPPHNVTFSTGFITILFTTIGAGLAIKIIKAFGFSIGNFAPIYSLIITTLTSIFWCAANEGMRTFCTRVFSSLITSRVFPR